MLFAVDVGNTNLTLGVFRAGELVGHWRLKTDRDQTVDGWGVLFRNLLSLGELSFAEIDGMAVSSVVPSLNDSLRRMAERYFRVTPLFVNWALDTGVEIAIENPKEAGADRIVNAAAAYSKYGGPCVAVDFGTAINFDVVSRDGKLIGAVLCVGVGVAAQALVSRTARLPQVEVSEPRRGVIGTNTVSALRSGLFYGTLGMVDGVLERLIAELGPDTVVVGTGGEASIICPSSRFVRHVDEHLTLEGLRLIWDRNRPRPG